MVCGGDVVDRSRLCLPGDFVEYDVMQLVICYHVSYLLSRLHCGGGEHRGLTSAYYIISGI